MAGRPLVGAIGGFLFGLGSAVFLQQAGVYPLTALSLYGFPVLGIVLGMLLARWAPLGGGGA
jgi:hypothetical protein